MKKFALFACAGIALFGFIGLRKTRTYDLKDPKGVNGLSLYVDSTLEPITGTSDGISGTVTFDPATPEKAKGKIVVTTSSIKLAGPDITSAMQGDWCLNPAKYPTIEFEVKKIENIKKVKEGVFSGKVTGDFTLHGVSKELTTEISATYIKDGLAQRGGMPGKTGDLLVLRSGFSINRREFNIAPDLGSNLIGDKIDIKLSVVAVGPN